MNSEGIDGAQTEGTVATKEYKASDEGKDMEKDEIEMGEDGKKLKEVVDKLMNEGSRSSGKRGRGKGSINNASLAEGLNVKKDVGLVKVGEESEQIDKTCKRGTGKRAIANADEIMEVGLETTTTAGAVAGAPVDMAVIDSDASAHHVRLKKSNIFTNADTLGAKVSLIEGELGVALTGRQRVTVQNRPKITDVTLAEAEGAHSLAITSLNGMRSDGTDDDDEAPPEIALSSSKAIMAVTLHEQESVAQLLVACDHISPSFPASPSPFLLSVPIRIIHVHPPDGF